MPKVNIFDYIARQEQRGPKAPDILWSGKAYQQIYYLKTLQ